AARPFRAAVATRIVPLFLHDALPISVRVLLGDYLARQIQGPAEDLLAGAVLGRQAQILNAGAHLVFVAVGGVVADGQSHVMQPPDRRRGWPWPGGAGARCSR